MKIDDVNASIIKGAVSQLHNGTKELKNSLERQRHLLKSYLLEPEEELLRTLDEESEGALVLIKRLSPTTSLMFNKLRGVDYPQAEAWKAKVGEPLHGQIIARWDPSKLVIIDKVDGGGLVTVFMSHKILREKFHKLNPGVGEYLVIQKLSRTRPFNYHLAVVPKWARVA